jgi:hypothetical protein
LQVLKSEREIVPFRESARKIAREPRGLSFVPLNRGANIQGADTDGSTALTLWRR